jgi:phosphodiesterase/alkaline phosphatase D-like protein
VDYGFDTAYGSATSDATLALAHNIVLTGLAPGRVYHYRVRSKNATAQESVSDDRTFTTLAARPARGR